MEESKINGTIDGRYRGIVLLPDHEGAGNLILLVTIGCILEGRLTGAADDADKADPNL